MSNSGSGSGGQSNVKNYYNVDLHGNLGFRQDESQLPELSDAEKADLKQIKQQLSSHFRSIAEQVETELQAKIATGDIPKDDAFAQHEFRSRSQEKLFRDKQASPFFNQYENTSLSSSAQDKFEEFTPDSTILKNSFTALPTTDDLQNMLHAFGEAIANTKFDVQLSLKTGWATSTLVYEEDFLSDSIKAHVEAQYLHLEATEKEERPPWNGLLPPPLVKYVVVQQDFTQVKFEYDPQY